MTIPSGVELKDAVLSGVVIASLISALVERFWTRRQGKRRDQQVLADVGEVKRQVTPGAEATHPDTTTVRDMVEEATRESSKREQEHLDALKAITSRLDELVNQAATDRAIVKTTVGRVDDHEGRIRRLEDLHQLPYLLEEKAGA